MPAPDPAPPLTRAERLKRVTTETHERLDQRIIANRIFDSRERFAAFLRVQHRLHQRLDSLYTQSPLQALIPDLPARRRLPGIQRDLGDLASGVPSLMLQAPDPLPLATALGWLYVAEGSALGGAVIYKMAARLGLDAQFGASHLAPPAEGVASHWRRFTAALNAVPLDAQGEGQAEDGARAAFAAVDLYVSEEFA